jgi:16S rRNA (adenine1518-N6/adenine1519-N6)-dimethyltransferase
MGRRDGEALPPIRKSLGQHFLTDRRILTRIIDALEPASTDTVVEIGPGRGALTEILSPRAGRVIAVELDRALAARLRAKYAGSNVDVVEADILQTDLGALAGGPYSLVGNVPYYITTPILFHALRPPRAVRAVYMVQREVADRMTAGAGEKAYGALSVNVQALATVEKMFGIPAGAFQPPPKVASAVVRVTPRQTPAVTEAEEQAFRVFVQGAFGLRRKQMRRVIRQLRPITVEVADRVLSDAGIDPEVRPETVTVPQFADLLRRLRPLAESPQADVFPSDD